MQTNSEVRLDRVLHSGSCGTWWSAVTAAGYPLGLLQFEPALIDTPAAQTRVAAAIAAIRAANPTGVMRTGELVVDATRAWLAVATPPQTTLAHLLGAGIAWEPGEAPGLALDVAEALRRLHAIGLGHGDLAPDTVLITPTGEAVLMEAGLLAALRDTPTDVDGDAQAWAALARQLADVAPAEDAAQLLAAAAIAQQGDLATAARRLAVAAASPPGSSSRETLPARAAGAVPAPRPAVQRTGSVRIGLRLGPGVPETAVAARLAPAVPGRRRWVRTWAIAMALAVLLGAAAVWWLLLQR